MTKPKPPRSTLVKDTIRLHLEDIEFLDRACKNIGRNAAIRRIVHNFCQRARAKAALSDTQATNLEDTLDEQSDGASS